MQSLLKKLGNYSKLLFLTALISNQCFASGADLSATRAMQVVIVKGSEITSLLDKPFEDYSIMVFSGDKLTPIPYQFDDWNERGFPYVPGGTLKVAGQVHCWRRE